MTVHQKMFAIVVSVAIFAIIISLVRNRKLQVEHSWLWLLSGLIIMLLVVWYDLLLALTALIGAVTPTTTLFIFGIVFLFLISLHFAMETSKLNHQVKNLAQRIALLEGDRDDPC